MHNKDYKKKLLFFSGQITLQNGSKKSAVKG